MPNDSAPRTHTVQQPPLELLPAVDVAGGQAVQLVQGKAGSEKVFGDPITAAARWAEAGAEWIHLVDLDAAFGRGSNADVIARVITETAKISGLRFELSGGIRDDAGLERALSTGCARVNIGTAALERPQWCEAVIKQYGDRVAVGLDVRGETLAARGWTTEGGNVYEMLERLDAVGCARYVVTDVNSDGMLKGPNYDLLRSICARTDKPVVASGGISALDDIAALRDLVGIGVEGAIIGTALYVGNFTLSDALAIAAQDGER
ncbi:bifunctional 1-(5-phosphoribosyl)-5-((5-phosphoribosylamino)methylideneamino)imidazole-4-carboxamide isomerase/phosphoribosylanthranilate isomerase PriA [Microlunatus elymi]|uniref:1-(5-phosphoribosyl)-5-[(5-phosphoribosylamino)methylideneamino] imidazole-4-carboxamide isomerase n=1 Tax=Microlunatus elymi TaxID=2596828 RepID=A0A516Q5T6_9ACTN|nr:bifunctional 1-(5-phosphoribosyl)-5-((5-phosphoribosylamino)methylideneamino)imidazole-4-carboxamide isomerase/phosphoribosylanthranilate isomerase PriA [Microlunatus elymi]QDP98807.1 bifunctional 1-(5-phosphoribosyl)-5-((5-phosphoribosylamino)methylideneamino)imidazole-4-carboxamide isomerase/phosphoribosylanthranilate isomerase PriA [Microlunatus elymi]